MTAKAKELQVVSFDIEGLTKSNLDELQKQAQGLTIDESGKGYDEVKEAHIKVKKLRTAIDNRCNELKAPNIEKRKKLLAENKLFDNEAERLIKMVTPILLPLETKRKEWEDKVEADRQEKIRLEEERVAKIRAKVQSIHDSFYITPSTTAAEIKGFMEMTENIVIDDSFDFMKDEAMAAKTNALEICNKAYKDRLQWETEQAEAKAEAERLAKQKAEQEAEAKRLDDLRKAEEEKNRKEREEIEAEKRKIQEEKDQIERDKKAEQERKDREEFERKAKEEAKIKAEKDAREQAEKAEAERKDREAREAKEAELKAQREAAEAARKEALKPDKEKLIAWGEEMLQTVGPDLKSIESRDIHTWALIGLAKIGDGIIQKAEAL